MKGKIFTKLNYTVGLECNECGHSWRSPYIHRETFYVDEDNPDELDEDTDIEPELPDWYCPQHPNATISALFDETQAPQYVTVTQETDPDGRTWDTVEAHFLR
jgi:hypothetical protein